MNWYKIAFKKQAMHYKEFFEFYALQGFEDETLREHPDILFRLIEIINCIRKYYLSYLIKDLADELFHYNNYAYDLFSKDYNVNGFAYQVFSPKEVEDIGGYLLKIKNSLPDFSISLGMQEKIIHIFEFPFWHSSFGGKSWAIIAEAIFALYNVGNIEQQKYNSGLMKQIRIAVNAIDVINSLEHNTSMLLVNLPDKESVWLRSALDIVFQAKNPVYLADISGNNKLSELYRREVLPLKNEREFDREITQEEEVLKLIIELYNVIDISSSPSLINKDPMLGLKFMINRQNKLGMDQFVGFMEEHSEEVVNYIIKTKNVYAAGIWIKFFLSFSSDKKRVFQILQNMIVNNISKKDTAVIFALAKFDYSDLSLMAKAIYKINNLSIALDFIVLFDDKLDFSDINVRKILDFCIENRRLDFILGNIRIPQNIKDIYVEKYLKLTLKNRDPINAFGLLNSDYIISKEDFDEMVKIIAENGSINLIFRLARIPRLANVDKTVLYEEIKKRQDEGAAKIFLSDYRDWVTVKE